MPGNRLYSAQSCISFLPLYLLQIKLPETTEYPVVKERFSCAHLIGLRLDRKVLKTAKKCFKCVKVETKMFSA